MLVTRLKDKDKELDTSGKLMIVNYNARQHRTNWKVANK